MSSFNWRSLKIPVTALLVQMNIASLLCGFPDSIVMLIGFGGSLTKSWVDVKVKKRSCGNVKLNT
jgi:hypothetical protein